jgi:hypothetical protein
MRNRFALMAAMLALPVATATAQNVAPRNVISIQPLSAMFTVFAGEYERAFGKAASWGIGTTYASTDNDDIQQEATYTSGDFKLRYYPQGAALNGFSLGGSVGYTSVSETFGGTDNSGGAVSLGVLLEYQWLWGMKKNFAMSLGAGAKSLMIDKDQFSDVFGTYPTARVSVGYAW